MNNNKGITLIGLIVTIVVITVVAGVSINVMTNAGIIEKTRKASKEYQYESEKEQWQLAIIGAKDFVTEIVDEEKLEEELVNWRHEEDKWISPSGNEYVLNENYSETETEEQNTFVFATEDEIDYLLNLQDYKNKIAENPEYDIQQYLDKDTKYLENKFYFGLNESDYDENLMTNNLYNNYSQYNDIAKQYLSDFIFFNKNEFKDFMTGSNHLEGCFLLVKKEDKLIIYSSMADQYDDGEVWILEWKIDKTKDDFYVFEDMAGGFYIPKGKKELYFLKQLGG